MIRTYEEKKEGLNDYMKELTQADVCLAFSGGVDSSLLLFLACRYAKETGRKVHAVTFDTQLHPACDLANAREIARSLGAVHVVLQLDEFQNPEIRKNPPDRCYLCKRMLFQQLLAYAKSQGISRVIEGTNQEDHQVYRPGIRAIQELQVESPLAVWGFSKDEVRACAAAYGLEVSSRPSTPCLATRLPYGDTIEKEVLDRIEAGEAWLRGEGYRNLRLRVHREILRIEVDQESLGQILNDRHKIIQEMKKIGFSYITLDLEGFRSGSMDEVLYQE